MVHEFHGDCAGTSARPTARRAARRAAGCAQHFSTSPARRGTRAPPWGGGGESCPRASVRGELMCVRGNCGRSQGAAARSELRTGGASARRELRMVRAAAARREQGAYRQVTAERAGSCAQGAAARNALSNSAVTSAQGAAHGARSSGAAARREK